MRFGGAARRLFLLLAIAAAIACGNMLAPAEDDPSVATDAGTDAPLDTSSPRDTGAGESAAVDASDSGTPVVDLAKTRIIFVSKAEVPGAALGGGKADVLCNDEAVDGNAHANVKGKTYRAWLSTTAEPAKNRHPHGTGPYVRPDLVQVAPNFADLVAGKLQAPINRDSTNKAWDTSGSEVWTGTGVGGELATPTCNDWTSSMSSDDGVLGELPQTGSMWTNANITSCESTNHVYCIEQ